ncbi:MAG: glutaredoxin [Pseudomonadota bacterium]|nr:glutaredoxin [Pseudomonadota bacterium]
MSRAILDESRIHEAIRERISQNHRDIVDEVAKAVESNPIVVVGMSQNPHVKRARKALDAKGIAFAYLEYGSYFGSWRRRNALKMWTGWPTLPMVFVNGNLIGGADELEAWIGSGELANALGG